MAGQGGVPLAAVGPHQATARLDPAVGPFTGGNVVWADFTPTPENLARVRENVLKSGTVGRLVANDFSAAMITAEQEHCIDNT